MKECSLPTPSQSVTSKKSDNMFPKQNQSHNPSQTRVGCVAEGVYGKDPHANARVQRLLYPRKAKEDVLGRDVATGGHVFASSPQKKTSSQQQCSPSPSRCVTIDSESSCNQARIISPISHELSSVGNEVWSSPVKAKRSDEAQIDPWVFSPKAPAPALRKLKRLVEVESLAHLEAPREMLGKKTRRYTPAKAKGKDARKFGVMRSSKTCGKRAVKRAIWSSLEIAFNQDSSEGGGKNICSGKAGGS